MERYEIKITGSGTKEEIKKALSDLRKYFADTADYNLDGMEYEDAVLMAEVEAKEDETFTVDGTTYIGNREDAEMEYERRSEWDYKHSFAQWLERNDDYPFADEELPPLHSR